MVRRHEGTAFMGGAHVFPGGRVDAADHNADDDWCDGVELARATMVRLKPDATYELKPDTTSESSVRLQADRHDDAVAYHVAAARELFEEAGVLLARNADREFVSLAGVDDHARFKDARHRVHDGQTTLRAVVEQERLRLALDALVLFAHWVTPPIDTRQFDTRFFMTRVPPRQTPAHDETETTHSAWIRPADAIAQAIAGDIVLPPPTWTTLREIEPFASVEAALAWAGTREIVRRMPRVLENGDRRVLVLPGDPLHPDDGGAQPPSETRFVLVDRRWRAER